MTDLKANYGNKTSNSSLSHEEWNTVMEELTPSAKFVHITEKGNFEIESKNKTTAEVIEVSYDDISEIDGKYVYHPDENGMATITDGITTISGTPEATILNANINHAYADENTNKCYKVVATESPNIKLETDSTVNISANNSCVWDTVDVTADNFSQYSSTMGTGLKKDTDPESKYVDGLIYGITNDNRKKSEIDMTVYDANLRYVVCRQLNVAGGVNIESDSEVKISSPNTILKGVAGFGSTMSFGETDEGIKYQYKATKKGNIKQCDVIQVEVFNNTNQDVHFDFNALTPSNLELLSHIGGENEIRTFYDDGITVHPGEKGIAAQASVYDIIKFVCWAKDNNFGPWGNNQNAPL